MGPTFDISAATAALKELYSGQVVHNMVYKNNPFLAMVPKFTDFAGKNYPLPIQIGVSQGRSSQFAYAQTNQSAALLQEFFLTRITDYSIATIDNQTMLAMRSDKGAFLRGAKLVIDSAFQSSTLSLAQALFGNGSGNLGVNNGIASGVITLLDPQTVVFFEVNQTLVAQSAVGVAPRAALGYVIAVNRSAGTVTVSATGQGGAAGSPTLWATNDLLSVQGDVATTGSGLKLSGLQAWLPTTITGADSYFGVNRSVDPVRLGGVYLDVSGEPLEEGLVDLGALLAREGGNPNVGVTNYNSWAALEKALGSRVVYIEHSVGEIGFRGIRMGIGNSVVDIFPDRSCPSKQIFLLQMDTWKLASLEEAPMILRYLDNNEFLRVYNSDAAEARIGYYAQLGCNAPGWNARGNLSQ